MGSAVHQPSVINSRIINRYLISIVLLNLDTSSQKLKNTLKMSDPRVNYFGICLLFTTYQKDFFYLGSNGGFSNSSETFEFTSKGRSAYAKVSLRCDTLNYPTTPPQSNSQSNLKLKHLYNFNNLHLHFQDSNCFKQNVVGFKSLVK